MFLLSVSQFVIQKQHNKPWIKARDFGILLNRSVSQWSQLGKNGLEYKLTKVDRSIKSNAESNLLKQGSYNVEVLASGRGKHFSQSVEEKVPLGLQIAFQHPRQVYFTLI